MNNKSDLSIEQRLYFLEQREHIRELVCDYSVAVDDRDIETIADLFTEDGVFAHADGTAAMESKDEIVSFYQGRLGSMGATYHFPHSHKIVFNDEENATGIVLAHAELSQEEKTYYTGLRYMDTYRREKILRTTIEVCIFYANGGVGTRRNGPEESKTIPR